MTKKFLALLAALLLPLSLLAQRTCSPEGSPVAMTLKRVTTSGRSVVLTGLLENLVDKDVTLDMTKGSGSASIQFLDDEGNVYDSFDNIRYRFGGETIKPDFSNSFATISVPAGTKVKFSIYVSGVKSYSTAFTRVRIPCHAEGQAGSPEILFTFKDIPIPRSDD